MGGSSDTPCHFMLLGNRDKLWLGGPTGHLIQFFLPCVLCFGLGC